MSVVELIKLGRKYLNLWPERAELAHYFQEYRAVQVSRVACRYMPALAGFCCVLQLYFGGSESVAQAAVYSVFMLSIPVQALIMLGVKADKFLPPALESWYKQGIAKINEQGGSVKLSTQKPRYLDLANLLHVSYTKSH